jgi:Holliday junction DNA helicase RuvA
MQVSETDMRLIGFTSAGERAWFRLLTVVQGVGQGGLAILSALTVEELQRLCGRRRGDGGAGQWRGAEAGRAHRQ